MRWGRLPSPLTYGSPLLSPAKTRAPERCFPAPGPGPPAPEPQALGGSEPVPGVGAPASAMGENCPWAALG